MSEQISPFVDSETVQKLLEDLQRINSGEVFKRAWTNEDLAEQIASLDRRMMRIEVTMAEILRAVQHLKLMTP